MCIAPPGLWHQPRSAGGECRVYARGDIKRGAKPPRGGDPSPRRRRAQKRAARDEGGQEWLDHRTSEPPLLDEMNAGARGCVDRVYV